MGLFDKFSRKKAANIWDIQNANDFIIAMFEAVRTKCGDGENMSALSDPERTFYIVQTVETEVNNGGFSQFFYNFSRVFADQMAQAFNEIGAAKTAEICVRALNGKSSDAILEKCDDMFYEYQDDLNALNRAYIMEHKGDFEF